MNDTNDKIVRINKILRYFKTSINHTPTVLDVGTDIGVLNIFNIIRDRHILNKAHVDMKNTNRYHEGIFVTRDISASSSVFNADIIYRNYKELGERIIGVIDDGGSYISTNVIGGSVNTAFINNISNSISKNFSNYTDLGQFDGYQVAVKDGIIIKTLSSYGGQDVIDAVNKYKSSGILS